MKLQKVPGLQDNVDTQIKTIDLTKVDSRISIWDYTEREKIQTFSDMMLDYLNVNGITDYKTDNFYAEYIPELIDTKIEENSWDVSWSKIFAERGFVRQKIRTAHIIDKETNAVVAKVNYIGDDDNESMLRNKAQMIFSQIVSVGKANIDYYINMLNYGLKQGVNHIAYDEEYVSIDKVDPKILRLMGYPFDNKRLQLAPLTSEEEEEDEEMYMVTFMCSIDLPTGSIPAKLFYCYGEEEWVIVPDFTTDLPIEEENPLGTQIKTINLTRARRKISIWDYMERDDIQTFSDMILDYMNSRGVTDYKADKFYAEYVPDLIDTKIEENSVNADWLNIVEKRGFYSQKIRTAHIIDKETNEVVAKANYIGRDDSESTLSQYFDLIFPAIVPAEPTNVDYYINMLNYGLKNGISVIEDGVESVVLDKVEPEKFLNLIGYPFDNKNLQLHPIIPPKNRYDNMVRFESSIDYPTGCIHLKSLDCYGEQEWVINPEQTK